MYEVNEFVSKAGISLAGRDAKTTADESAAAKLKHLSAHIAHEQPSMALSDGLDWCGQQSMSSIADISVMSLMVMDFVAAALTAPTAGSMATDKAIRKAKTVRPIFIALQNTRHALPTVK